MKLPISNLNKLFESRVRLAIMSVLIVNESFDFNDLKELLEVTDGNLASHLKTLEDNNMLIVSKQFKGKKPNTTYSITETGIKEFRIHLKALEEIIKTS